MSASGTGPSAYERPPSLVDFAATALRHKVLTGAYAPGERLRENALAEELGISRPPLREALRLLEREGLLLQEPRKGVSVTPLTLHDVYEIFTLRRDFETLAVRVGVPVRDDVKLQRCRDAMSRLEAAARAGNQARVDRVRLRLPRLDRRAGRDRAARGRLPFAALPDAAVHGPQPGGARRAGRGGLRG